MNNIKAVGLSFAFFTTALLTTSGTAFAGSPGVPAGAYIGADIGQYEFPSATSNETFEDTNFRAFLGYQLNRHFAVEGGVSVMPLEDLLGNVADLTGVDIALLAKLPVTSRFSAYAKLGYWDWSVDDSKNYAGFGDTDMLYGIGLEYKMSPKFKVRLDATRYGASDTDIDTLNAGLVYSF